MRNYYVVEAANHGTEREHSHGTWEVVMLYRCDAGMLGSLLHTYETYVKPALADERETRFRRISKSDALHYRDAHGMFMCKHGILKRKAA